MFKIFEKILIQQIKKGDEQAFAQFYNTYKTKIYSFIYFKVSSGEKAQDLTDEVFMKAFQYLKDDEAHEIENFQAFVFKTARNLVIDFYRTRKQNVSLDAISEIASKEDISKKIDDKLKIEIINKYLSTLKPEYIKVVKLHLFDELSFKEIAEITGDSEGSVRMRAHRGMVQLKKRLKERD